MRQSRRVDINEIEKRVGIFLHGSLELFSFLAVCLND